MPMERPIIILIGGGTASGKTTIAEKIKEIVKEALILNLDNYYKKNWDIPFEERKKINYDHPNAFEWELFKEHVKKLLNWKPIDVPIYDFKLHMRKKETRHVEPSKVIIIDGIFALYDDEIRELADIKIYVDTPDDIRFIRRLTRDIKERGRTMDSVIEQYLSTVRPMHIKFVEPTKKFADVIIPNGFNPVAVDLLKTKIERYIYV